MDTSNKVNESEIYTSNTLMHTQDLENSVQFIEKTIKLNKGITSIKISEASTASMVSSPELNAIKKQISDNVSVRGASAISS